ncbi:MAG: hypothetical protein D6776_08785 [Planctomycetota bacterium]|nr:MAG: hypothetical protein D6776_08785 [Planctomycetota bacterium]
MQPSESLHKAFLAEMQALEDFRMAYVAAHPRAQLERDDPDVRRLIEALAFFSARTREVARENVLAARRRLFRQYFDFLLQPVPAMGLVQARVGGRFAERLTLPAGTELLLRAGAGREASFRTTDALEILPLRLRSVRTLPREDGGIRLALDLQASHPQNEPLETLRLQVNHMGSYAASLRVLSLLGTHLERAVACFDTARVTEDTEGLACRVRFGQRERREPSAQDPHPLEAIRRSLYLPEAALGLRVDMPGAPRRWQRLTIAFDLDHRFPASLRLGEQVFALFCVPVTNLTRAAASPITVDGLHERYAIRPFDPALGMRLHTVEGVYELGEDGSMRPLVPSGLGPAEGSYEIERDGGRGAPEAWLRLEIPDAYERPRKVALEASWTQPWFSRELAAERVTARLATRVVPGLAFEPLGPLRPELANPLAEDMDALLRLVLLRNRPRLDLGALRFLLDALGVLEHSPLAPALERVQGLEVDLVPRPGDSGLQQRYRLLLAASDASVRPLVDVLAGHIVQLLDAWLPESDVVLEVCEPGAEQRSFRPR